MAAIRSSVVSSRVIALVARRRRWFVDLPAAALLAVALVMSVGAAPSAGNRGPGVPIHVLAPRAGAVIVAASASGARRLRVRATVEIARRAGRVSVQLNGHPIRHAEIGSGKLTIALDRADGLAVGENLLWVSAGRRHGAPSWVRSVRFVVGYRAAGVLGVRLRLGTRRRPAAMARMEMPDLGIESLRVTLNGRPVRVPAGERLLDLAELGPVKWGVNHLRVRLVMLDGRVGDRTLRFQLSRHRDVAVARLQSAAVVGHRLVLDAGRSLIVRGVPAARGFRWVLVRRPPRSHARLGRRRGARVRLRADVPGHYLIALMAGHGPREGYDLLDVSVTQPEPLVPINTIAYHGSTPGVQVGSTFYPDPMTGGDFSAIQVLVLERDDLGLISNTGPGNDYTTLANYLNTLSDSDLVIITHPGDTVPLASSSLSVLDTALRKIGGTLPARWTFPYGNCWSGTTNACLVPGTGNWGSWQRGSFFGGNTDTQSESFTVIGVPGLAVGQAWRGTAFQSGSDDGRILGYLTKGTPTQTGGIGDYTVINGGYDQYAPVDTCVGSSCAARIGVNVAGSTTAGSATITSVSPETGYAAGATIAGPGIPRGATVVSMSYYGATVTISSPATASATDVGLTVQQSYAPPALHPNGLHVVVLDRTTLRPIENETVTNTSQLLAAFRDVDQRVGNLVASPDTGSSSGCIQHVLPPPPCGMDDQRLIILQSVGNGQVSGTATTPLLQYIDELGGTPDLLLDALSGQHKYALVGAATNLPWHSPSALESSTATPVIPNNATHFQAGEISGLLEVNRDGLYTPLAGDPISATNVELPQILYQPAQPWPYAQDTQELSYIAQRIGLGAYPDVRSAYLDANLAGSWTAELDQLKALTCHDPSECGPDFNAVKAELELEFPWVTKVYGLGADLLSPYESGAAAYFDVAEVTSQVRNSLSGVSDSSTASMNWLSIVSDVMYVGSGVATIGGAEGLSAVLGLAGSAGNLATDVMQPDSTGSPANKVVTSAGQLAGQMAQQQTAYIAWIGSMERILLSDYGKLSTVGTAIGSDPAWTWVTGTTTSQAITALQANATASAYSALVPVAWPGFNLTPDFTTQQSSNDVHTLDCSPGAYPYNHPNYPFASALAQNQFHAITSIAANGAGVDQAWTLASVSPSQWSASSQVTRMAALPSSSLTDYIYGPYATGHWQNGTYYYGAYQYAPVWWRDTYNAPSHTVCSAENASLTSRSLAYGPPDIAAPPP